MAFSLFQTVLIRVVLFSVERKLSQACFLNSLIVLLDTARFLECDKVLKVLMPLVSVEGLFGVFYGRFTRFVPPGDCTFFPCCLGFGDGMVCCIFYGGFVLF